MLRECFFCHKPLSIQQRTTVFCSLRCQTLARQMEQDSPRRLGVPGQRAPLGKGALRPPAGLGRTPRRPSANQ